MLGDHSCLLVASSSDVVDSGNRLGRIGFWASKATKRSEMREPGAPIDKRQWASSDKDTQAWGARVGGNR
jgi:hypothetical protein